MTKNKGIEQTNHTKEMLTVETIHVHQSFEGPQEPAINPDGLSSYFG